MSHQQTNQTEQLWRVSQVKMPTGLSERTIWRLCDSAKMPAPIRIGRSVRWRRSDILRWIQLGCPNREVFEAQSAVAK
ncbi:helix-turn-helix transcriptional regulator [Planctomycetota bacterium]